MKNIEKCPICGRSPDITTNDGCRTRYYQCKSQIGNPPGWHHLQGPYNDINGEKWNELIEFIKNGKQVYPPDEIKRRKNINEN